MRALAFWKAVTMDRAGFIEGLIDSLREAKIRFCVIGGLAVNAYADPTVTLDLDLVIAADDLDRARAILSECFDVQEFPHSLNISAKDSNVRAQLQKDPRYEPFLDRALERVVLEVAMPVAAVEDVLQGKIWAFMDPDRRASKRQKDLADIARLVEVHPEFRALLPADIAGRLV